MSSNAHGYRGCEAHIQQLGRLVGHLFMRLCEAHLGLEKGLYTWSSDIGWRRA